MLSPSTSRFAAAAAMVTLAGAAAGQTALAPAAFFAAGATASFGCDPPMPAPGQTVVWTAAMNPIEICSSATIPAGGVVELAPGARLTVQSGVMLSVGGELRGLGTAAEPIQLSGAGTVVASGTVSLEHATVALRIDRGRRGVVHVAHSTVSNGDNLSSFTRDSLLSLEDVEVLSGWPTVWGQLALDGVEFANPGPFAEWHSYLKAQDVTVRGAPVTVIVDYQPRLLSNVDIINPGPVPAIQTTGGGITPGSNLLIDAECDVEGASMPVRLLIGGLHPDSVLPQTGSTKNVIEIGGAGAGSGVCDWPNLNIPYYLSEAAFVQGRPRVGPGATFLAESFANLSMRGDFFDDTASIRGRPGAPVLVRKASPSVEGFAVGLFNATAEHVHVEGGQFTSSTGYNHILECSVRDHRLGIALGDAAWAKIRGTQILDNDVGVKDFMSHFDKVDMNGHERPNIIEGNGIGAINEASASGAAGPFPAEMNWWGHESGPYSPFINPTGQGDTISFGVEAEPWRTERPDLSDTPPFIEIQWPFILAEPGDTLLISWDASDDGRIVSQRILMDAKGGGAAEWQVIADDLAPDQRLAFITIPDIGLHADARSTILRVEATDDSGYRGHHDITLQVPVLHRPAGSVEFNMDLSRGFVPREERAICYSAVGMPGGSSGVTSYLVLDTEDNTLMKGPGGSASTGQCTFIEMRFPTISTNRARLMLFADGSGNDNAWYFSEPFEIRPLAAFPDRPPEITMTSPAAGERFAGGRTIPVRWDASDDEGLRQFKIQISLNGGRTWSTIETVDGAARAHELALPPLDKTLDEVQVRVVAVDHRFQATAHGDDRTIGLDPGDGCYADCDGSGSLDFFDFLCFQNEFAAGSAAADCDGSGSLDFFDFLCFQSEFAAGCP